MTDAVEIERRHGAIGPNIRRAAQQIYLAANITEMRAGCRFTRAMRCCNHFVRRLGVVMRRLCCVLAALGFVRSPQAGLQRPPSSSMSTAAASAWTSSSTARRAIIGGYRRRGAAISRRPAPIIRNGWRRAGSRRNTTIRQCRIRSSSMAAMPSTALTKFRGLGRPVSHGCVRLDPGNAAILFGLVEREGPGNTTIVVH